ncbi:MAG: SH3 domain-containing protein [Bacteroidia bacterium]|nr:SH3 domain-containing protein [Bacteroidia bacterium]MDW8133783.1 SH3 domain-containing protein [Bacteroidia bacterium]
MRKLLAYGLIWSLIRCASAPKGELQLSEPTLLRENPSKLAKIIDTLPAGITVAYLKETAEGIYICHRGERGWLLREESIEPSPSFLSGEPLENSIITQAGTDSVIIEVSLDSEGKRAILIKEFRPWFLKDSIGYAGFYEGLIGEELDLVIVNFIPRLSLLLKLNHIEPETMELREEQIPLGPELRLEQNLIWVADTEAPLRRAEFVLLGSRPGLLVEKAPGKYIVLWKRLI